MNLQVGHKESCSAELQVPLYSSRMSGIETGKRIKQRREALGLSTPALAKKIGGITYQALQAIEKGGNTKHLPAIARALGVSVDWLETGETSSSAFETVNRHLLQADHSERASERIRVLGMGECGDDGVCPWNGDTIEMVMRPPSLAGVPNGFAVYAKGESMSPRYHHGELVYIHPGKPVGPGNYVLVQMNPKVEGEPPRAVLKRLVRRSASKVTLEQYNPPKQFHINPQEIVSIQRVVGSGEA